MKRQKTVGMLMRIAPEHYTAIGKVASNWATFELLVNSSLWQLAKVDDEIGACFTAQIGNVGRSLDALFALARHYSVSAALVSKLNKFNEKTTVLGMKRNRIIHDPWAVDPTNLQTSRLEASAKKRLVLGYQPMPTSAVNLIADAIVDHIDAFEEIMQAIFAELKTSHGDPPPLLPL